MVIGHKKQWELLKELASRKGKLSHAYLFAGQEKIGKKTIALEWSSLLLEGKMKDNQHPDFILIEPIREEEKTEKGVLLPATVEKEIKIGQIRNLISKLSFRAYSADLKIAVIDEAHLMNQESQGALLKTLEEPKGDTVLILVSNQPERLLPTILSRVETMKFYPVKKEEIKKHLKDKGIPEKESEEIAEISAGRPGSALDFISDPKKLENLKLKLEELERISDSDIAVKFQYAKDLSEDKQLLKETLDIWMNYFRNALLANLNNSAKEKYPLPKLKNILKSIQNTKFLILNTNVSARLALETLMLEL
jgi:DNA polymerase-3 subunit delta'